MRSNALMKPIDESPEQRQAAIASNLTLGLVQAAQLQAKALRAAGQPLAVRPLAQVVALRQRDPWREASEAQRAVAVARLDVVSYVIELEARGLSAGKAIELMLARASLGQLAAHTLNALQVCAKAGRSAPTRSTVFEWRRVVAAGGGRVELLEAHKGRVVLEQPAWWGPAIEYFNAPSKPDMSAVWRRITEVDGLACTYEQVRGYLSSVPAMYGRHSPARIGRNLYRLTQKAYIKRCTQNALPGDVYVADGYRADVYLTHPVTGDGCWRAELTVAMDLRSRVIVGWRADEHEGTYAVQNMWAEAFARHNHVPPFIYVDNGSGYKNKLMSDEATGFYKRVGVQEVIHAIPGNPHGKGWIERFFHTMKDDFLRLWMPQFYCGTDASPEDSSSTVREIKAGRLKSPSLAQFADAFNAWLERYHSRPHPEHAERSKMSFWADLVAMPPAADVSEMKRQAVQLTIRRGMVQHGKRQYRHPDLLAFNGQVLTLEYDLMDDQVAVMRDAKGRWICDATLVQAIDAIGLNRMDEKRQLRAADAVKRLEKKMDEQKARAGLVFDAEASANNAMSLLDAPSKRLGAAPGSKATPLLDVTDLDLFKPAGADADESGDDYRLDLDDFV